MYKWSDEFLSFRDQNQQILLKILTKIDEFPKQKTERIIQLKRHQYIQKLKKAYW